MLDYVVTTYLYFKYSRLVTRLITYFQSTFVNNEWYAQSAVKTSLHEHILHASPDLQWQICYTVENFEKLDIVSTFGWESETTFPIVVGDVVRSFIGAIFVHYSFEKDTKYIFKHKASSCVCISKLWGDKYYIEGKR